MKSMLEIFKNIQNITTRVDLSLPIERVTDDSRNVTPGSLFIAVQGSEQDGAKYIDEALARGAVAIVADVVHATDKLIRVLDAKKAREKIVLSFYDNPATKLSFLGITGTNGKTTISYLVNQILKSNNVRTALSGTIATEVAGTVAQSELTTPGFIKMQEFCAEAVKQRCSSVVMEVSSHAIDQNRILGIEYDVAVFSNLSQDHLDYHKTMDEYFLAKKKLFTEYMKSGGAAVVNIDDAYGRQLVKELAIPVITYSRIDDTADLFFVSSFMQQGLKECTLRYRGRELSVITSLFGAFNEENILAAVGAALAFGVPEENLANAITYTTVPGRMEIIPCDNNRKIFVDYAHTPDALERVLLNVRDLCENKLRVVFGCGGDRDTGKRKLMGAVADEQADVLYVTSDNPRTESPETIIEQIMLGIKSGNKTVVEVDRKTAIETAVHDMQNGDCLVIAGKGHEDYQIIGTTKVPFDDKKIVWNVIENEAIRTENIRIS